ncbi:hypothetical protein BGZ63DRAFT_420414 [Mariannaea sp. PMI_226]|nr:hypothetical protein BGZ63DRAFT_420414 [Mariannaea sp. PMI_226]
MKKPWKSTSSAGGSARPRTGPHTIRGRISGPVPIPSPMDNEFSVHSPGTNVAMQIHAELNESQTEGNLATQEEHSSDPLTPQTNLLHESSYHGNHELRSVQPIPSPVPEMQVSRPPRTQPSNTVRHSIISADAIHLKDRDRPSRKQSKLRGAIRKFLDRKKKHHPYDTPSHTDSEVGPIASTKQDDDAPITSSNPTHQNDPRPTDRPDPRTRSRPFPGAESKRSASLPITEFDRALRSHSIRPEDVRAIESARNSLSAEFGLSRRQTGPPKPKDDNSGGLSPRPASSQGRDSRGAQHDDDPSEIGRAITSDYMGSRRRSRSLSGLPEVDEDHDRIRRRSDEIRYWRESYDPAFMSPVSSDAPDGEDSAERDDEIIEDDEIAHQPLQPPPEPFKFDTIATLKRLEGLKVKHTSDLETRVCNLESRVHRLEQVLDQACRSDIQFPPQAEPPRRPDFLATTEMEDFEFNIIRPRTSPTGEFSEEDKGEVRTLRRHRQDISAVSLDQPTTEPAFGTLRVPEASVRPTSMATIRGVSSLPVLSKDPAGSFTLDHYATLLALVHTERSAREALEAQVKHLGYQLSILAKSTPVSRDTQYDPPPTAKSFGDKSAFDHDDDENEAEMNRLIDTHTRTIDPEDSGIGTGHGDESEYSEVYETPREEGHSFGAFGENLKEDHNKKSARTLSLSQITHKKQSMPQSLPHAV